MIVEKTIMDLASKQLAKYFISRLPFLGILSGPISFLLSIILDKFLTQTILSAELMLKLKSIENKADKELEAYKEAKKAFDESSTDEEKKENEKILVDSMRDLLSFEL